MKTKLTPLGKGLGALLPPMEDDLTPGEGGGRTYFLCSVATIRPNPDQPRKEMDPGALQELADSIREKGVLQPLIVRRLEGLEDDGYELIAGERRWRAAQLAGLEKVPVLVREVDEPEDRLELALIENIQRQNLNPLEEAISYSRLVEEFGLTQEEIARKVGKERSTVANTLRLMGLPAYAKEDLASGRITMGHSRAMLSLDGDSAAMQTLRDEIIHKELSVRQAEALARRLKDQNRSHGKSRRKATMSTDQGGLPDSYCRSLAAGIENYLGTKARIIQSGGRGRLEIEYYSADDLDRVLALIMHGAQ